MNVLPSDIMDRLRRRLDRLYGDSATPRLMERFGLLASRYGVTHAPPPPAEQSPWDQRDALLITYADMIRAQDEKPLVTLQRFLGKRLQGVIPCVHLLPFFPYSSDDGFSVIDYRGVNPELGSWNDVRGLASDFRLMFDLVLNHVSSHSAWFRRYLNGYAPERAYFLEIDPSTDLSMVVRPRTSPLLSPAQTPRGERFVWTTFSEDQIDLNFANPDVLFELLDILLLYARNGARIIRLDAIAYLWKEPGTSCINLPQTHEVVKLLRDVLEMLAPGVLLLTETNLPHEQNTSYFGDGDEAHLIYQFSLPPLLLHALHTGHTRYLTEWAAALPPVPSGCTYLNFTASHDGVGVRPLEGLVPGAEIQELADAVRKRGGYVSTRHSQHGSESPYELNITYFDALSDPGHPDTERHIDRFLCSQTIMLALQGIPAVYLHSLTATHNDRVGVERTGQARAINRRRWNEHELNSLLDDSSTANSRLFHEYVRLLRLRAQHPAFHPDGRQIVLDLGEGLFAIERVSPDTKERIVCISNVTHETRNLNAAEILFCEASDIRSEPCRELIQGQEATITTEGSLQLPPYKSVWLIPPGPVDTPS